MNGSNAETVTDPRGTARDGDYELLGPILNTYLLLYLGVAAGHATLLSPSARPWMLATTAVTLALGLVLRLALYLGRLRPRHTETVIWSLLLTMTANPFMHMAVTGDVHQTTGLLFVLALAGYFIPSLRQLLAYQTAVLAGWMVMLPNLDPSGAFAAHYGFFLGMAVGFAAVLRMARFKLLDQAARLAASTAMIESLLESLPVGVLASAADGQVAFANHEAARLLETPVERLTGMGLDHPDWRLFDEDGRPQSAQRVSAMLEAAPAGDTASLVVGRKRADGRILWLAIRAFSVDPALGDGIRRVVTFADITERLEAAWAVVESERLLRSIIERVDLAIIGTDASGRVTRFNAAAEQLTGYPRRRALGWTPETLLDYRRQNLEPRIDGYVTSRSGEAIPVRLNRLPLGEARSVVWVVRDMRPDLQREREARLVDKMAALEVLAGGIAHDFNNLMLVVFGNIDMARDAEDRVARECLDAAMQGLDQARDLTRQLLAFTADNEPLIEAVDVVAVLRDVTRLTCSGTDIDIGWQIADVSPVAGDLGQLHQLFVNVILNARQTMQGRGRMRIEVGPDEAFVRVTVGDADAAGSGAGIDAAVEPPKGHGAGLGLALARGIAERHRGSCEVSWHAGRGTTITVRLPVADVSLVGAEKSRPGTAVKVESPPREAANDGSRALIMDDDEMVREALSGMLEHLGYAVDAVSDGAAAISRYRQRWLAGDPPEIVILDLTVKGGLDGASAARRITEINPQACLVVASGYSDGAEMADHRSYGFRAALRKPFRIADLERAVRAARDAA